ncbi:unnamed protein product [Vitrella brassicaformis CCMP3155]|uniref:TLDc domain-containing protein n=1 Tax=Vitrella brassicaformis (strain CCMP3155) TaxID=1169540 RepID=A0A0G4EED3_VITBC|nr:unnamed protein product [Vitrella brassicaformis CCMP3155]|eukprot:CEL94353.1 unnamed protein product [Vitrella brassicaformis CCMP3155]
MVTLSLAWTEAHLVRRVQQQVSPPDGTSLSASEYQGLLDLMGSDNGTELNITSLYRSSVNGTTYDDLLDSVGDAEPLVFVIRKDKYVFGAFINCGLMLPDTPTGMHEYDCDLWWFSLTGHFDTPTKIDIDREDEWVTVAGREGREGSARDRGSVRIGDWLALGDDEHSDQPAADIRSCAQRIPSDYVPEGYTGKRDAGGHARLGGSFKNYFMADEIEVLHVT